MAVRIRLSRKGKRHQPSYRVVVTDARTKRDGKALEIIGWYNPLVNPPQVQIDQDRLEKWLKNGAQMSDRVRFLVTGEKRMRTKTKKKKAEEDQDQSQPERSKSDPPQDEPAPSQTGTEDQEKNEVERPNQE